MKLNHRTAHCCLFHYNTRKLKKQLTNSILVNDTLRILPNEILNRLEKLAMLAKNVEVDELIEEILMMKVTNKSL